MFALTRTLLDITLLAKGPEEIPRSWILLYMSIGIWLFALFAMMALLGVSLQIAWANIASATLGLICYGVVLATMGVLNRAMQTMSALIGIGGLITLFVFAELILFTPLFGSEISILVARATMLWSIPVKGHIIARAINWPWYGGFVIALFIYLLQDAFADSMSPEG